MENKYCWRCKTVVPFLDNEEYNQIVDLIIKCQKFAKKNPPRNKEEFYGMFAPVREAHEKMTGYKNMHHIAILHHNLYGLGPDCPNCGKPLRTKNAKLCPECGWKNGKPHIATKR